jgi:hypothetical protein
MRRRAAAALLTATGTAMATATAASSSTATRTLNHRPCHSLQQQLPGAPAAAPAAVAHAAAGAGVGSLLCVMTWDTGTRCLVAAPLLLLLIVAPLLMVDCRCMRAHIISSSTGSWARLLPAPLLLRALRLVGDLCPAAPPPWPSEGQYGSMSSGRAAVKSCGKSEGRRAVEWQPAVGGVPEQDEDV